MSLRADRPVGGEGVVSFPALLGGLDTKSPAHAMPGDFSPDLSNVLLDRRCVARRGGMSPLIREQPGVSSLRNKGYHMRMRSREGVSSADADYLTVPGCAHAGHRPAWDDAGVRNAITLDFFCVIDDLTTSHGGNSNEGATPFGPAPYTLRVRPIISKGPVKRTAEPGAPSMPGTGTWQTTSRWGPLGAAFHAMPFAVYLFNNSGTWEFRFSFHNSTGSAWQLNTLATNCAAIGGVRTGVRYHVVAGYDIAQGTMVLRIGTRFDMGAPAYVTVTAVVTGVPMVNSTTGPIQLFDCPQELIEAPAATSATRPPGLELGAAAVGGYWFASKRFEGQIEDVVIYRGLLANLATGALNRTSRINPDAPPQTRLQHWPIESHQEHMAEEVSGLGNHFYFAPSDPFWNKQDGGIDGGALAFNGATAYCLLEQSNSNAVAGNIEDGRGGTPNWRTAWFGPTLPSPLPRGAWEHAVKTQLPHGLEVACWVESIEPNHETVIAEAHAAIRISITHDGFIRAYTRDTTAHPGVPGYVVAGTSARRVVPGHRYHIIALRTSPTTTQLYVNGTVEEQLTVAASPAVSQPVGGLTIGMGARVVTSLTDNVLGESDDRTVTTDRLGTDVRTAFFGRIEYLRVLVGSPPTTTGAEARIPSLHQRHRLEDYVLPYRRHFVVPYTNRSSIVPTNFADTIPNSVVGHVARLAQLRDPSAAVQGRLVTSIVPAFELGTQLIPTGAQGGLFFLVRASVEMMRAIGSWDFSYDVADLGNEGSYLASVEYRVSGSASSADLYKFVHVVRGYVDDNLSMSGSAQLRCVESDMLTESDANYLGWYQRAKPYGLLSPDELAPQWAEPILGAVLGTNAITLLADWREEITGEQFVLTAARRSLYWAKPRLRISSPWMLDELALWFAGQPNDYCKTTAATPYSSGSNWETETAVVDLWCYPTRLDGRRVLIASGNPTDASLRYCVYLLDGQLIVEGQVAGGWFWRFQDGDFASSPSRQFAQVSVALNRWSHIAVRITNNTVMAWINGERRDLFNNNDFGLSPMTQGAIPAATTMWVGGLSRDQRELVVARSGGAANTTLRYGAWHGYLTEIRESADLTDLGFVSLAHASAPRARSNSTAATRVLYHAASDQGWRVVGTPGPSLDLAARELIGIRHDLEDTGRTACDTQVFRNRLMLVHPSITPQQVIFNGFDRDAVFSCVRLGMQAPGLQEFSYQSRPSFFTGTTVGAVWPANEAIGVYASFLNVDGEESEIAYIGTVPALNVVAISLHIGNVPRSLDPQVVARRIYVRRNNSDLIPLGDVRDTDSRSFDSATPDGIGIGVPPDGERLVPPRAKRVGVAQGTLLLANLEGNPNAFAASGEAPGYFPLSRLQPLDSPDGQGIVGLAGHLGGVYLFKRNGTWVFSADGGSTIFNTATRQVNGSVGAGGGTTVYDNMVFGASDRGVWVFDGANFKFASASLDPDYLAVDVSEPGLLAQQGAYFYPDGQYWLSVRLTGQQENSRVYVLQPESGGSWTRLALPPHVAFASLSVARERPRVCIGTVHGQILQHNRQQDADGVLDAAHAGGSATLTGFVTPGSSLALLDAGATFDITGSGLRGVPIQFFVIEAGVPRLVGSSVIVSNSATTLVWRDPMPVNGVPIQYAIGGFSAHWASAWLASAMGSWSKHEFVDLEFNPVGERLILENLTAANTRPTDRIFDSTNSSKRSVLLTTGYQLQPTHAREQRQGRYLRIKFGSQGVRSPFEVTAFAMRMSETGTKGMPS